MKHLLIISFIALLSFNAKAQQAFTQKRDSSKHVTIITEPKFPGGTTKLIQFIGDNFRGTGDKGKILVSFIIEPDGSVSDIRIKQSVSEKADKEAIRVISLSPKWTPGTKDGEPVRVAYVVPINLN